MKHKKTLPVLLALILVLTAAIGGSWAYFTDYEQAKGGLTISLGHKETVRESFKDWTKHVVIGNDQESEPVFIRVKAFTGSDFELIYSDKDGLWTPGADGFYYYALPVDPEGETSPLDIKIENVPETLPNDYSFNVVVVYEAASVLYEADGTPYADWSTILTTGEGGNE